MFFLSAIADDPHLGDSPAMQVDPVVAMSLALPAIGGIVWAVRLEGKLKVADARIDSVIADVRYIRDRIDQALKK